MTFTPAILTTAQMAAMGVYVAAGDTGAEHTAPGVIAVHGADGFYVYYFSGTRWTQHMPPGGPVAYEHSGVR